jgi:NADPH:quinone reductase-like Zn-dependent oxidoreductase
VKAILCTKYGTPEGLQLREVQKPSPRENEVLIKIFATTVTSGDAKLRHLSLPLRLVFRIMGAGGISRNSIPGHELAGEIEAIGSAVTRFKAGDQVFASTGMRAGAHAEFVCLPEDAMMAGKPDNLTYEQAAAVPVGGNTALHLLRQADIQPGQKALIYGASGSVGTYAVQLARHFGAEVTGVCSTPNLELVRSLGATHVIDYTTVDFAQSGETYDLIFDAVGKTSQSRSKDALKKKGQYLSVSSPTSEEIENLLFLKDLIEAGELRPVIDRRYPLAQIVEAHRYVDRGHKRGNVVITVRGDDSG